jgi:hypothetical protein
MTLETENHENSYHNDFGEVPGGFVDYMCMSEW